MGSAVFRRHRVTVLSTVVVITVAAGLVGFATNSPGYTVHHPELNDGGVWVSMSGQTGAFGRFNRPVDQLDGGFYSPGTGQLQLDVVQEGEAVVGVNTGTQEAYPIDAADAQIASKNPVHLPGKSQYEMNGPTLAVLDSSTGRVRATRVDTSAGVSDLSAIDAGAKYLKPVVGPQAAMAVGPDGTIYVASASTGKLGAYHPTATGFSAPVMSDLGTAADPTLQLATVGNTVVGLDPTTGIVFLPGGKKLSFSSSPDPSEMLQESGPASPDVIIATSKQLISVPLEGSSQTVLSRSGTGDQAAAPAVTPDGCVYAAWSGPTGVEAKSCDGQATTGIPLYGTNGAKIEVSPRLKWRVNHGYAVLNDLDNGAVWTLDRGNQLADWASVLPPPTPKDNGKTNKGSATSGKAQPPTANPDPNLGARPGRTAVLHVLDNDSSPSGGNLAIFSLPKLPTQRGVTAQIAPDGQTIRLSLPSGITTPVQFTYTIRSDQGLVSAPATVTVTPHPLSQNGPPELRTGFVQPKFTIAAGSTLDVAVLSDWRDPDSDEVSLVGATGGAAVTPDGRIHFAAPGVGGHVNITYSVTDGMAKPTQATIPITVLPPSSTTVLPPKPEPDVALGSVGLPVTVYPLGNDLPGADPNNPSAVLQLATRVASVSGTDVYTDLRSGAVTIVAHRAQTFLLPYSVSYGSQVASGVIRIDAKQPTTAQPPVAMPDTATLHGSNPAIVDVLANDYDPQGQVLVVQRATATSATPKLNIAIVSGRFLDITNASSTFGGSTVVRYDVTDGKRSSTGEVTVNLLPQTIPPPPPQTVDDEADVRAGDSVVIPVLQNDTDPDGAPLSLKADSPKVISGGGIAAAAGNYVRYAAPSNVTVDTTAEVDYAALGGTNGQATPGHIHIHIHPLTSAAQDSAPIPASITTSVIAGGTLTIPIPTTGVDPDGDSVTVTGLAPNATTAGVPELGRVLSYTATSIKYQAFPTSTGTDTFGYSVMDRYGKSAAGQISIGVVTPGDPQPPVAVDDVLHAAPGKPLHIFPEGNDFIASGDSTHLDFAPISGDFTVDKGGSVNSVQVDLAKTPSGGATAKANYTLTGISGLPSNIGHVTVFPQVGFNNPPVARDDYAKPGPLNSIVAVNVLDNDYDPDGPTLTGDLTVTHSAPGATNNARQVMVHMTGLPQTIWYTVSDGQSSALAVIHVPAAGHGVPYADPNTPDIQLTGSQITVDLAKYIIDPAQKPVSLTEASRIFPAPATALKAVSTADKRHLVLTRVGNYDGPASVTVQVTDGASISSFDAQTAYVTLRVQVGAETPVMNCPPTETITLYEGNPTATTRDIALMCHVWLPSDKSLSDVHFTSSWVAQPSGVNVSINANTLSVQADSSAKPSTGVLHLGIANSKDQPSGETIAVDVISPPLMTLDPITLTGVQYQKVSTFNIRDYAHSVLANPDFQVTSFTQVSGLPVTATHSGSTFTLTPGSATHGTVTLNITATDVPNRQDRAVTTTVTVDVAGLPATPTNVQVSGQSDAVTITWAPLAYDGGGGTVTYTVDASPAASQPSCDGSGCHVSNLVYGTTYEFRVTAHNALGSSQPSQPNAKPFLFEGRPPAPTAPHVTGVTSNSITVSWTEPTGDNGHSYNQIVGYRISVNQVLPTGQSLGTREVSGGSSTSLPIGGLVNDDAYLFQIQSVSHGSTGDLVSPEEPVAPQKSGGDYPQGPPLPITSAPTATALASADGSSTDAHVTWPAADPNGDPATVRYQLHQYQTSPAGGSTPSIVSCADPTATQCDVSGLKNDGSTYAYTVSVTNGSGATSSSESPQSVAFEAAGTPGQVVINSLNTGTADGTLDLTYTTPPSNGRSSTVTCNFSSPSGSGSCGTWAGLATAGGQSQNQPLGALPSGVSVTVSLQDCNGSRGNLCDTPTSQSQYTYGPPDPPTGASCPVNGSNPVTFAWNPPGGRPGERAISGYQYALDGGGYTSTGATSWSNNFPADGQNHTLHVKSVDSAGEVSGGQLDITCQDPPPPPPPTVTVAQGRAYYNAKYCSNSSCAYINITTAHFNSNVTCTLNSQAPGPPFVPDPQWGPNQSRDSNNYFGYPGYVVTATCSNGSQTASGSITWP